MAQGEGGGVKPRFFTEAELKEVELLAPYLNSEQLADHFMISRKTLYRIMERQPEVQTRYKKAKAKVIAIVAKSLIKDALDGDRTSRMFYLKTQAGWKESDDRGKSEEAATAVTISYSDA